jgi:RNA polymerase sigma factor (sigma-70 family)
MDTVRLRAIVDQLRSGRDEDAWASFIDEAWPTLQQIVRHFERDPDDAADCFLFVCEQLRRNRCARLLRFDPDGPARFTTWLELVVGRLCVDWHRRRAGRFRVLQSIARLSALEREVFHAIHERGGDIRSAWATLRLRFPNLTLEAVVAADGVVRQSLGGRDYRVMAMRSARNQLARKTSIDPDEMLQAEIADQAPDPEVRASDREVVLELRKAVGALPASDRLLLKLRYVDELTLAQVARVTGLRDPQTADRRLREVTKRLQDTLGGSNRSEK